MIYHFFNNRRITTRGMATLVGIIVPTWIAINTFEVNNNFNKLYAIITIAILGAIIANILLSLDVKPGSRTERNGGSLLTNFFVFISCILCFVPIIGTATAVLAVITNYKIGGLQKIFSILSLSINLLFCVFIAVMIALGK